MDTIGAAYRLYERATTPGAIRELAASVTVRADVLVAWTDDTQLGYSLGHGLERFEEAESRSGHLGHTGVARGAFVAAGTTVLPVGAAASLWNRAASVLVGRDEATCLEALAERLSTWAYCIG